MSGYGFRNSATPCLFLLYPSNKTEAPADQCIVWRGFGFALYIVFVVGLFEDMFEL